MNVRTYLRASTDEQDASRARRQIEAFAGERGLPIVGTYVENESGAKFARPELFRLISDSRPGDALLIEQVDRLSRLTESDWRKLRAELDTKQIRVVALDLPTSWQLAAPADEFTSRMFSAVNGMMLDVLAAVARKDYEDRRRRQAQGQAKAKAEGKYRGRPEDVARNAGIASMLRARSSWTEIERAFGCSRATIAKVAKRIIAEPKMLVAVVEASDESRLRNLRKRARKFAVGHNAELESRRR
jgi:DNA invertase Pin-like site-specific DNA recombinase